MASNDGTKLSKIGEPDVVRMPLGGNQVLYGMRQTVHPTPDLTARDLRIGVVRRCKQHVPRLERDNGIHGRIDPLDVVEIGGHDLAA